MNLYELGSFLFGILLSSIAPFLLFGFVGVRMRWWSWSQWGKVMVGTFILIFLIIPSILVMSDWFQAQSVSPELATLVIVLFILIVVMVAALRLPFFRHSGRQDR